MKHVIYRQEVGDGVELVLGEHTIPADMRTGEPEQTVSALLDAKGKPVVLRPVEGSGIGQYTFFKPGAPATALQGTNASDELAKLREQLAAAEKAKIDAEARADATEKAHAASEQSKAKAEADAKAKADADKKGVK